MTAVHNAYKYPSEIKKERASGPDLKASVTVEAALTIPIFLFAAICLISLFEIRAIQIKVAFAAENAAKEAAADAGAAQVVNPFKIKNDMLEALGEEGLGGGIVSKGAQNLRCGKSYFSYLTDEVHVIAEYSVSVPVPYLSGLGADFREEVRVRGWTGQRVTGGASEDEKIVYITKDSAVYHVSRDCTYLKLSIRFIPYEDLKFSRNIYGGKYKRCERCVHAEPLAGVYITDSGGKYHSSLNCGGLKRTVYAVKKSQAGLRRGCSRCSQ